MESGSRVIGGVNPASTEKAAEFYAHFVKRELHKTDARTAERYKLGENTYKHKQRIAFAQKLSVACQDDNEDHSAEWHANRILAACGEFSHKTGTEPVVACMGLAFKPDIDDLRESPARYIVSRIISESQVDVLVVEPNIKSHKSFKLEEYQKAYQKADIIVWLVRHKEFVGMPIDTDKMEFDFCGVRK
jgi:UDP-N-acetyl-D-mannosaminuronic acid dehydrogenase